MRISDCSSDVCSSDLDPSLPILDVGQPGAMNLEIGGNFLLLEPEIFARFAQPLAEPPPLGLVIVLMRRKVHFLGPFLRTQARSIRGIRCRSEEHTSELQSLMRISYAVFCLKKKKQESHHKTNAQYMNKHNNTS